MCITTVVSYLGYTGSQKSTEFQFERLGLEPLIPVASGLVTGKAICRPMSLSFAINTGHTN